MAFFPCTYFSKMNIFIKKMAFKNYSTYSDRKKTEIIIERNRSSFLYLEKLLQLFQISREKKLSLIVENPFSSESFLYRNRPFDPSLIDSDRRDMGDFFQKPTMYFGINVSLGEKPIFCTPRPGKNLSVENINKNKWERSRISPEYAKNFIKYILQIENNNKE